MTKGDKMRKRLVFNLADRAQYFDSLKKLHGRGDCADGEKTENRPEAELQSGDPADHSERVRGMQGVLGVLPSKT